MKDEMEVDINKSKLKDIVTHSVLDAFDLLKNPKAQTKLSGGARIISLLHGKETEKDVQYVLKRLVRSLGANVPNMRIGYFATLVSLLKKFEHITVSQLFELIKKELHANGSSKSEIGDVALGQILVCSAIFRSGLMLKCTEQEQKETIHLVLNASKKKSYLVTVAYLVLLDFVNGLDKDQFSSVVWTNVKQEFIKDLKEHSLDSLYFLMVVSSKFPDKVKITKLLGVPEILCEDNIHVICEKIMTGIDFGSLKHPIFSEIGTRIAKSPHLKLFWTSGIDSQLVKHNRNRELVAINMLTTILSNLDEDIEVIPELISRNFFKLFMDWFKGLQTASKIRNKRNNEDDHKIMIKKEKELLNALAKAVKSDKVTNKIRVEVLKKLLFNPGEINFTEITGTSIVRSIIADLNEDGIKKLAKLFKGVLLNTSKKYVKEDVERSWYNNERLKAAELLSYLVGHESVKDDTDFKLTYMKLLMCFGFFKIGGDENVKVSKELSGSIKTCFYRCFSSRFTNVDTLVTVLSSLSNFINTTLAKEQLRVKLEKQFSKENMECWEMVIGICKNIEKHKTKTKIDKVFLILLYQLGLFLFSEPKDIKMAKSSIKELKSCYEHYKKENKVKKNNLAEDEPEWIEVLVEVLLSILSTDSSILRAVVQCVFKLLWEYLTPSSVGQIVSVLDPDSETNPLTQGSDSENEESTDEENETDDEESDKTNEKNDENDSGGEASDLDEDDEDMKTPDQLRLAVQMALSTAAQDDDNESIDADMIDEEQGKKLDEALAEAFKQFHQGKGMKSKKDQKDKKSLSHFRVRVLDLIDIYLEKDPSMDICLGMIAPLIRCLEFCIKDSEIHELESRVRSTIKTLTKIRKFSSTGDITIDVLCDYLKSIIDKESRPHFMFQALGDVMTNIATFIISCSQKINSKSQNKNTVSPLVAVFSEALHSYFQNRNCFLPIIFFHRILQTEWEGTYDLVPLVMENIFNTNIRQFRRSEAVELMSGFYRSLNRCKPTSNHLLKKLSILEETFGKTMRITLKDGKFEVKKNYLCSLRKLINTMKLYHESSHVSSNLDFQSLLDVVSTCKGIKVKSNVQDVQREENNKTKRKLKKKKNKRKSIHMNGDSEPQEKRNRKDSGHSE